MMWQKANTDLIAKAISELTYEELFSPTETSSGEFELVFKDATYKFQATKSIWDMLLIKEDSISRNGQKDLSAPEFFIDAQSTLGLSDIILSNFIEEMNNSLYCEQKVLLKQFNTPVEKLIHYPGEEIQTFLSGHPKLIVTKGRLGWGAEEIEAYGPEAQKGVRFLWIAVKKELSHFNFDQAMTEESLLLESMDESEYALFSKKIIELKIDRAQYTFLPVHPWQWNRFVKIQFFKDIYQKNIIEIGVYGDEYLPQISVRSFYNNSRKDKLDIKLPISILNTSAVRGIAAKYMDIGNKLSHALQNLCANDEILKNVEVLIERAGNAFVQSDFNKIVNGPYRYKEYLGAVWRDSSASKASAEEKIIMTGCLFHKDHNQKSLIAELVATSGLSTSDWLSKYFQEVVIPLYHLQAKYGVGLVAHGQNIMLKMKNSIPCGLIVKDFQGDLRLSEDSILLSDRNFEEIALKLDKLPAHYLIHDLITGHFVTVLRFISSTLLTCHGFKELEFYKLLAVEIENYIKNNPVKENINLLTPKYHRVLVNKVRFEIGYADSNLRPKPALGLDLLNPLFLALKEVRGRA